MSTHQDSIGLDDVPWSLAKRALAHIRRRYYTHPWPTGVPSLVCVLPPAELERRLRVEQAFEGTPFSYRYESEAINLRRPWGLHNNGQPMEIHVRGRPLDGERTELVAHVEFSRYEACESHIDEDMVDWQAGAAAMREILQDSVTAVRE